MYFDRLSNLKKKKSIAPNFCSKFGVPSLAHKVSLFRAKKRKTDLLYVMVGQTIIQTKNILLKSREFRSTRVSIKYFIKRMDFYIIDNNMSKVRYLRERTTTSSFSKARHGIVSPENIFKIIPLIVSLLLYESSVKYRKIGYLKYLTNILYRSRK